MRTRKRPTLYSEESVAKEAKRKQRTMEKRGRPKTYTGPTRPFAVTYNKQVQSNLSKEENERLQKLKQHWQDLQNPMQAKLRILPLLRRGLFEKCLELMTPVPGNGGSKEGIPDDIKSIFRQFPSSAGFLEFLNNIRMEACLACYDVCDNFFVLGAELQDNLKIAQALRFWWNSLSFATRRRWELHARSLVYGTSKHPDQYKRPCADGYEVPITATKKILADEERWELLHTRSLSNLEEVDTIISCPLCEKDENADPYRMGSIKDIQDHFFHYHWQVHGYACHFCGTMFATADELMSNHSECQEWVAWNAARILTGAKGGKLGMSCCRMLLCCSDCGWYTTISRNVGKMNEESKMNYLKTFFSHHNNDGLLAMLIYFPTTPSDEVDAIRFTITSMAGGDPQSTCTHCKPSISFRDPADANEHYSKEHRDKALVCDECHAQTTTDYLLKQHKMSHVHDNSYLADFLSHSARIFPPPTNLSYAPRCGWKNRAKTEDYAYGGLIGGIAVNRGLDLVDPMEETSDIKARLEMKRRREGKTTGETDGGEHESMLEEESFMARKVREKLAKKYADCEGMGVFEESVWLKNEDAVKFGEWMDYWESPEGKAKGGPPKKIVVDVSPSIVRIPSVEVELQFKDTDTLSGFLLNDNVFYCVECDSILKGEQAFQHLKLIGDETKNKCALDEGQIDENPHTNENLFQMYSFAASPSDSAVPCPHCPHKSCSITGLRVHVLTAHGKFVKCKKCEDENVTNAIALKFDIRTRLAKATDARLGMLPSGMLPQMQPMVTDVDAISEMTWSQIIFTKDNTDARTLSQMKQLNDQGWAPLGHMHQATPRPPPGYSNILPHGGRNHYSQGYQRPVQTLAQRLSFEQALSQQQRVGMPQIISPGRVNSNISPLGRTIGRGGTTAYGQPRGGVTASMIHPSPRTRKLVHLSHHEDNKEFFTCQVCANNVVYEREIMKAHITRSHLHMCGHCTSAFMYEQEARNHIKMCRATRDQRSHHPDPRLPHMKTRCPMCPMQLAMSEMTMHLLDEHICNLDFDITSGRLTSRITMVEKALPVSGKEPEVERLRYKYYVPPLDLAKKHGYLMCQVCGLNLPDAGKLQVHLKLHPEFMYFCWICPRVQSASLGQVNVIAKHMRDVHLKNIDYNRGFLPCPQCQRNIFHRPVQHLMYECEHNNICQLCRDLPAFDNVTELREHREKCHYNALRRFECSHCSAYFSTTSDFTKHMCDVDTMKTTCSCGMGFKTRKMFNSHFQMTHVMGDVCKLCCKKIREGGDQAKHIHEHGKTIRPTDARHLLICAYGELNLEAKTLYTHVSNASFRLRGLQGISGGSEDSPVQLSDDDDDIIEVPSTAVQQERNGAVAAAAHVLLNQPTTAVNGIDRPSSVLAISTEEADVLDTVQKMVNIIVKAEHRERREDIMESQHNNEQPLVDVPNDPEDDDIVMVEDIAASTRNLSARVRVEADDTTVGGQDHPGYEDEDGEKDHDTPNQQPVMRQFTPEDDEELCVVAEVENTGCATAAATINKQREKKFGCPKCSSRFMTQATLSDHIKNAHQFDAGQSTLMEELGMPVNTFVWICKSCCLCFQTEHQKKIHCGQHGQRTYGCEHCSGCAYNNEVINQHHRRVQDRKVAYICGECKLEFDHETSLHEHSSTRHNVILFYFCKTCEMGSTEGAEIYRHFMMGCPHERKPRPKTQEEAVKCIGVCPANQLHFQPLNIDVYRNAFSVNADKFVSPSICNHRSLIVACDRQISCNECKCLENMQRHIAFLPSDAARIFESQVRAARAPPALSHLRHVFDQWMREQREKNQRQQMDGMGRQHIGLTNNNMRTYRPDNHTANIPSALHATVPMGGRLPVRQTPTTTYNLTGFDPQEAQRRHNERLQAVHLARANGATRPPQLTTASVGGHLHNGGPAILRGRGSPYSGNPIINGSLMPSHRPPMITHANLSTMGSLQSIAAVANGSNLLSCSPTPSPVSTQCTQCSAHLQSQREVFLHTLHTSDRGAFVCAECPIAITEEKAAIKHIINHMDPANRMLDMDLICPFPMCRVELPTLIALKNHMSIHNPPLRHTVKCCPHLHFGSDALSKSHVEAHETSIGKNECCILCGTMENWQTNMVDNRGRGLTISHMMKHAFKHLYYCKLCDMKQFEEENQIITHFVMCHTNDEGDSRSCNDCSTVLKSDNDYKMHCMTNHVITELFEPKKLIVKIPQTFSDYLGVGQGETTSN